MVECLSHTERSNNYLEVDVTLIVNRKGNFNICIWVRINSHKEFLFSDFT